MPQLPSTQRAASVGLSQALTCFANASLPAEPCLGAADYSGAHKGRMQPGHPGPEWLHSAAGNGHLALAKALDDAACNLIIQIFNGNTALHIAASKGAAAQTTTSYFGNINQLLQPQCRFYLMAQARAALLSTAPSALKTTTPCEGLQLMAGEVLQHRRCLKEGTVPMRP